MNRLQRSMLALVVALGLASSPAGSRLAYAGSPAAVIELVHQDSPDDALRVLKAMPPGSANTLPTATVVALADVERLRPALMSALDRLAYEPVNPAHQIDNLWMEWALWVEPIDQAAAKRAVSRVRHYSNIVALRLDRRFDASIDRGSPTFDPRWRLMAQRAQLQLWRKSNPDSLEALNALIEAEAVLGEYQSVLTWTDVGIADLSAQTFRDSSKADILWGVRAIVLLAEGRHDQVLEELREASGAANPGPLSGYLPIFYASVLTSMDRPREALAILDRVDGSSPVDEPYRLRGRACGLARLGRTDEARVVLTELEPLRAQAPHLLLDVHYCLEDDEAAAALLISMLEGTDHRQQALIYLASWRPTPNENAGQRRRSAALKRLSARSDVRAALERVGRSEAIDLYL